MNKKKLLSASRDPSFPGSVFALRGTEPEEGNIVFHSGTDLDASEMLKITKTGFYVRGKLVDQDDKEAEIVYNAFKEWMVYSALTRKY
jgi:hypothetical protein